MNEDAVTNYIVREVRDVMDQWARDNKDALSALISADSGASLLYLRGLLLGTVRKAYEQGLLDGHARAGS